MEGNTLKLFNTSMLYGGEQCLPLDIFHIIFTNVLRSAAFDGHNPTDWAKTACIILNMHRNEPRQPHIQFKTFTEAHCQPERCTEPCRCLAQDLVEAAKFYS